MLTGTLRHGAKHRQRVRELSGRIRLVFEDLDFDIACRDARPGKVIPVPSFPTETLFRRIWWSGR